jgi:hypothetical protein
VLLLGAGIAHSSLNIVGYYNVPLAPGQVLTAMTCSLLAGTPANRADLIIPYSVGDSIKVWAGTNFKEYAMDSGSSTGWSDPATGLEVAVTSLPRLVPGSGFFYTRRSAVTNITIVGRVPTGTNRVTIPSGLSLLGSPIPYSGLISTIDPNNKIGCPVPDGGSIHEWNGMRWVETDRDSASSTDWSDPATGAEAPEPVLKVGQGFFLGNNGPGPIIWEQVLNPKAGEAAGLFAAANNADSPEIRHISIRNGEVWLAIFNPGGGPYSVQFSVDGLSWAIVVVNQNTAAWSERCRGGPQGYYRVARSAGTNEN